MFPKKIGRYQIIRQLGVGGMGRVFLAHDPRFPRDVALKLLDKEPGAKRDSAMRERFQREARTIARLEHHAIVPVYDFGEFENRLYLVMRLMGGGSLQERLQDGPLPPPTAISIVQRIASALDKAHANGVIHRDIKPANILFDDEEKPYLSDFGIAKLYETSARLTRTGGIIGTPHYMSPEQGRGEELDGRSDIYSLGVLLFQMVTGIVPFDSDTPFSTVLKHIQEPAPPARSVNPALDANTEAVIARALAKDPQFRFNSAGAMASALAQPRHAPGAAGPNAETIAETPVSQAPGSQTPPAPESAPQSGSRLPWRRVFLAAGGLLVLFLSIAAGVLWAARDWGEGAETPPPQQLTFLSETDEAAETGPAVAATGTGTPTATPMRLTATPTATAAPSETPEPSPTSEPSPTTSVWIRAPGSQPNQIAFVSNRSGRDAIYAVDLDDELEAQLTEPRPGQRHWWPEWCGDDKLVFEAGDLPFEGSRQEVWVRELQEDGEVRALTHNEQPPGTASNGLPACSPDGNTVAFSSLLRGTGSSAFRLGLLSLANPGAPFRLVGDGYALAGDPSWSADGQSLTFMHFDETLNNYQIYRVALDEPDEALNLTDLYSGNAKYPDWSPATGQITFACHEGSGDESVWHLCITPDDAPDVSYLLEEVHRGPERDNDLQVVIHAITPSWSPDGRAIAYASDVDGDWDIYIYELATGNVRNLTADWPADEMHPSWRK